jgi:hypothetical protein
MASKKGKSRKKGTLIRGADGALYFIPASELPAYTVPDAGTAATNAELEKWAAGEKKGALHAVVAGQIGDRVHIAAPAKTTRRRSRSQ